MDSGTTFLIKKYSPMWTNKQVWKYEQIHDEIKFDVTYSEPGNKEIKWKSKLSYPESNIREVIIDTFEYLSDNYELCIRNSDSEQRKVDGILMKYLMAVIVDIMIDDEICLKFREEDNHLIVSIDLQADVIDCKEFFEEFYHLATGFNYDVNTGIPKDQTEAEIYLTRLQEEFDEKIKARLGDVYMPGNNDPDSINRK